ncbi:mucin-2-like isoform X3 [Hypanus sabinus]|uniref:mucin-2-like isoform X3 n=1 Tax=Hypanus sabinus TaxID=79690 RepID=UPI0028C4AAF6|nr:mucin-2-like isoform X3 [Hypanus sabinus]
MRFRNSYYPLNHQEGGTVTSGPTPPCSGTVITLQPSGRRYRSLRTHTTRFRNIYYPLNHQEPQGPHHQVQEQLLPLNHQEEGTGASGHTPPGSGQLLPPQPSGRRYRNLRAHTTRFRNNYYPSTIRKKAQEPQDPHHQVQEQLLPPQLSGRRYRSLRTHTMRFRNSYYPLNHQEGGTGTSGPIPPCSGTVITLQPSGRRYRSLRTHTTRFRNSSYPLNHQEGGTGASGPTPPGSGTVITPQPSGRRYRSLRTHTTRFRDSYNPSTIRKEVQEPQDPHHQVQEQLLPLNHQEEVQEPQDPHHQVQEQFLPPQPSGRRYRRLRTHTTRFRDSYNPSTIRKEVQEPQDPHHQVQEQLLPPQPSGGGTGASGPTPPGSGTAITPQPSGRRYRSLRTHTTRFRNSYYPSTIRKEVQEPQDPHHQVQEQLLPLNHQERGTGASGPTPPGSGTAITPQPSGRRYRSLRTHTTRFRNSYYPSTIRKEVQEPQDPHHQVQEQLLRFNHQEEVQEPQDPHHQVQEPQDPHHQVQEQLLPLNHQEGGTGASGPTPPGSGTVITLQPSGGGTGASGPTPPGSGTVITPQPSGKRYRSLRSHTTRFRNSYYPLNYQEGGTGASGPTP